MRAVWATRERPHDGQRKKSLPESCHSLPAAFELFSLPIRAPRAASTVSRGRPECGTGTGIHCSRAFSFTRLDFLWPVGVGTRTVRMPRRLYHHTP